MKNKAYGQIGYQLQHENAAADRFDYLAHTIKGSLQFPIPFKSKLRLSYKYRLRDYLRITPSIGEERKDIKQTFHVRVFKKFLKHFKIKLDYKHIDSESNLASVDSRENIIAVNLGVAY